MENYKICELKLHEYLGSFSQDKFVRFQNSEAYGLALLSCQKHFYGRFLRSLLTAKRKIVELIHDQIANLTANQRTQLKSYLKPLSGQATSLLNDRVLPLHMFLVDFTKKQQSKQPENDPVILSQFVQLLKSIIRSLNPLLLCFFVNREYKRRTNIISPYFIGSRSKIRSEKKLVEDAEKDINSSCQETQNESIIEQIEKQFSTLTVAQLIDKYLKEQQNKIIDSIEVCKVCSQKIKLKNFQKHMKNCSKKAKIKENLTELEEKRKKLYAEVEIFQNNLMLKANQISQRDNQILRIMVLIKEAFASSKKKGGLRRNTHFSHPKRDPIEEIKNELELFQQSYEKSTLLQSLVKNKQQIILAKKKLAMVEIAYETEIKCTKDSQISSFKSLESSINNVISSTLAFKTKKSLFASKNSNDLNSKTKQKKSINKSSGSCSSISIKASESSSNSDSQISEKTDKDETPRQDLNKSRKTQDLNKSGHITKSLRDTWNLNNLEDQKMGLADFEILKFLGKGAYGRVYLVRRKITNDLYALKHIKLESAQTGKQLQLIKKEHEIFKKIEGDHLIRAPFAFSESFGHFFVLQFMPGGDLSKILSQQVYLSEEQAKFYLAQIILAVEHLHKCDIIHRDLKPENIVIDKNGHIKLTDFGLSDIKIQDKIVKAKSKVAENCKKRLPERAVRRVALVNRRDIGKIIGTPDYIAPEIINQTSINNHSIDWWSLGVIAYQMLVGCGPFSAMTVDQILKNIIECKIEWPAIGREEEMMSPQAHDLISRFLDKNFKKRIGSESCEEIKNHPFFKQVDWDNIKNTSPPIAPKKQLINLKEYLNMPEDLSLREQIVNCQQNESGKPKKCIDLQNFVRYDVLLEQTYESVEERIRNEKKKMERIKTMGSFLEDEEKQNLITFNQNPAEQKMMNGVSSDFKEFKMTCITVQDWHC